ncbi:hypothetical protein QR680_018582 [Steinernema hermaphroditum]|uniref:DUF7516 domain-containing protein n=1 Tax=Steinernema hermaphroditum TaxID=289476 RepID=A0AA39HKI0_9BILA|nr:hypothetical protein QR680_018582 [Steinernema hermaphroditum]
MFSDSEDSDFEQPQVTIGNEMDYGADDDDEGFEEIVDLKENDLGYEEEFEEGQDYDQEGRLKDEEDEFDGEYGGEFHEQECPLNYGIVLDHDRYASGSLQSFIMMCYCTVAAQTDRTLACIELSLGEFTGENIYLRTRQFGYEDLESFLDSDMCRALFVKSRNHLGHVIYGVTRFDNYEALFSLVDNQRAYENAKIPMAEKERREKLGKTIREDSIVILKNRLLFLKMLRDCMLQYQDDTVALPMVRDFYEGVTGAPLDRKYWSRKFKSSTAVKAFKRHFSRDLDFEVREDGGEAVLLRFMRPFEESEKEILEELRTRYDQEIPDIEESSPSSSGERASRDSPKPESSSRRKPSKRQPERPISPADIGLPNDATHRAYLRQLSTEEQKNLVESYKQKMSKQANEDELLKELRMTPSKGKTEAEVKSEEGVRVERGTEEKKISPLDPLNRAIKEASKEELKKVTEEVNISTQKTDQGNDEKDLIIPEIISSEEPASSPTTPEVHVPEPFALKNGPIFSTSETELPQNTEPVTQPDLLMPIVNLESPQTRESTVIQTEILKVRPTSNTLNRNPIQKKEKSARDKLEEDLLMQLRRPRGSPIPEDPKQSPQSSAQKIVDVDSTPKTHGVEKKEHPCELIVDLTAENISSQEVSGTSLGQGFTVNWAEMEKPLLNLENDWIQMWQKPHSAVVNHMSIDDLLSMGG